MASNGQVMYVAGREFEVELTRVPTKSVKLDPLNPRIRYLADTKGISPKTNEDICKLLLDDDQDVRRLYHDIQRDGGLHEPILVNNDNLIIEGNSRAACILKLFDKNPKPSSPWSSIPARLLRTQMSAQDVAALQAYYHVRMKNKWVPFAQAAHIYRMNHEHGMSPEEIHQATGMHVKTIETMIGSYRAMKKFSFVSPKKSGSEEVVRKYSYVHEMMKSSDPTMVEFRKKEGNVKKFVKWVNTGQFNRGEDVRKLPTILKNAQAKKAFEEGGIKKAEHIVKKIDPSADSQKFRLVKKLDGLLGKHFLKQVEEVRSNPACGKMLGHLAETIEKILRAAAK